MKIISRPSKHTVFWSNYQLELPGPLGLLLYRDSAITDAPARYPAVISS